MDLNELLHDHQIAVMKTCAAGDDTERAGHFERVSLYAKRVRELRDKAGVAGTLIPPARDETVILGSYDGPG